jgi:hypothetical protein
MLKLDVMTTLDTLDELLERFPAALKDRQRYTDLTQEINKLNRGKPPGRDPKR